MNIPPANFESGGKEENLHLRRAWFGAGGFTFLLWLIKAVEIYADLNLLQYGVYPQQISGLIGILCAPLIHSSWGHLAANTGPVLILGTALFYGYPKSTKFVLPIVYLGSGAIVWLFARASYHVGASGLTFGVLFFICTLGLLRRDKKAIALSLAVFFLYGGMLGGLFPENPGISFETHLAGAGIGILLGFALKHLDPPPPPKRYSWEDESEEDLDGTETQDH